MGSQKNVDNYLHSDGFVFFHPSETGEKSLQLYWQKIPFALEAFAFL